MTFFSILGTILIEPLKLVFEVIFDYANRFVGHPGLAIIFLSLIMNILVLPLYRRADAMQEETRDREAALRDGASHIKKTFSGDERMMILQTYYRQNHYKPTDSLNGSVSLLLEIPFFMAAYQFLSHLKILDGVSLGPIKDLGSPDGLLVIGGLAVNLLPIIMTLINVISSALYLKGFPLKTKIQLYAMALFFLVFLYSSPACLVFYWTLNNVFSLVKTIFYKLKNPQRILRYLCFAAGLVLAVFGAVVYNTDSLKRRVFLVGVGVLLLLPLFLPYLKKAAHLRERKGRPQPNGRMFLSGSIFLTVLIGLLIPSVFIAASPQEYIDITYFHNPLWYIVSALCLSAGIFLVWMRVFYWLASPKGKVFFDRFVWILSGVALVDYMFFGTDLGIISSTLQYENGVFFSRRQQLFNLLILVVIAAAMYFCARIWKRLAATVLTLSIIALSGMSALNLVTIKKSVDEIAVQKDEVNNLPFFNLSKTGQNVVVIMLDRAVGEYVPYIFQEKPELKQKFSGFTYYRNTLSFGYCTNFAAPALFGGYEYTPVELNKRSTESLVSKHNEALKVLPTIFSENGYHITVCDPPYANYQWIPDLTIYDDISGAKAYITKGRFGDVSPKKERIENNYRNFFCFSVMKSMPLFLQSTIYDEGLYHHIRGNASQDAEGVSSSTQVRNGMSISTGFSTGFTDSYNVLENLPNMTNATGDEAGTFLLLCNEVTHEPTLLQTPDYVPAQQVDNTAYDASNTDRFIVDGKRLKMENDDQMSHYHVNIASFLRLGEWFDCLRKNGIYDNTRIILVSDHGRYVGQDDDLIMEDAAGNTVSAEAFYPLLMVKDFNSKEFVTSDTFMTNADVPVLALQGLVPDPINPFTGKPINSDEKYAHDQFVTLSNIWDVAKNNGNTFLPSRWAGVKDNLLDRNNWTLFEGEFVLDKHAAP